MTELALYTLPVRNRVGLADEDSQGVPASYVAELTKVTSPEELITHVERWQPLWRMEREKYPEHPALSAETELVDGSWKARAAEIWGCVQAGRTSQCEHFKAEVEQDCLSAHILMPSPFVRAFLLAEKFQTLQSAVLEQLYGDGSGF